MPLATNQKPTKPPPPPPPPPKDGITLYPGNVRADLETNSVTGGEFGGSEYAGSSCSVPCSTRSLQLTRSTNLTGLHHNSCRSESSYSIRPAPTGSSCCQGCTCHISNFPASCCGELHCGCQPTFQSVHCNMPYRPRMHSPCGSTINHAHHSHSNVFTNQRAHHPHSPAPAHPQVHDTRIPQFFEQHKLSPSVPLVCQEQLNLSIQSPPFIPTEHSRHNQTVDHRFQTVASSTNASNSSIGNNHNNGVNFGGCGNSSGIGSLSASSSNVRGSPIRFDEPITRVTSQAGLQNPLPCSDIPPPLPPMNPGLRNQPLLNRTINHNNIVHHNSDSRVAPPLPPPPLPPPPPSITSRPQVSSSPTLQTSMTSCQRPPPLLPHNVNTLASQPTVRQLTQNNTDNDSRLNGTRNQQQSHIDQILVPDNFSESKLHSSNIHPSLDRKLIESNGTMQQERPDQERLQKSNQQTQSTCAKCGQKVLPSQAACKAMEQIYHATCFVCCECNRTLIGQTFWPIGDKVYCKDDYKFSGYEKCAACSQPIYDMILPAVGKYYHPRCFKCSVCGRCLDGVAFTVDVKNKIYCLEDYQSLHSPECAACKKSISPIDETGETVRVVSQDKSYHIDCYCCEDCGLQLTDEEPSRSYPLDNHLLCQLCHINRLTKMQAALTLA